MKRKKGEEKRKEKKEQEEMMFLTEDVIEIEKEIPILIDVMMKIGIQCKFFIEVFRVNYFSHLNNCCFCHLRREYDRDRERDREREREKERDRKRDDRPLK